MAVSYPRGMQPPKPGLAPKGPITSAPGTNSPVPAPAKPPVVGIKQTSNPYTKAAHHHAKIGAALRARNVTEAMHHTGHMLQSLKAASGATGVAAPGAEPDEIGESETASGTDDGPTSPTLPGQTKAPSTAQSPASGPSGEKKPFNPRAFFGAMKKRAGGYPNG